MFNLACLGGSGAKARSDLVRKQSLGRRRRDKARIINIRETKSARKTAILMPESAEHPLAFYFSHLMFLDPRLW
jgi:hypothetical protein